MKPLKVILIMIIEKKFILRSLLYNAEVYVQEIEEEEELPLDFPRFTREQQLKRWEDELPKEEEEIMSGPIYMAKPAGGLCLKTTRPMHRYVGVVEMK